MSGPLVLKVQVWDKSLGVFKDQIIGEGTIDVETFVRVSRRKPERKMIKVPLKWQNSPVGFCKLDLRYLTKTQYSRMKRSGSQGSLFAVISEGLRLKKKHHVYVESKCVVMPDGSFRKYWDCLTCLLLVYTALFTPVQMAFLTDQMKLTNIRPWAGVFIVDRIVDAVFILDIFVNFRSAYTTHTGVTVFDARDVAWRYMTSWFAIDIISVLPFELLEFTGTGTMNATTLRSVKLIRLLRLLKLAKVVRASRIMKRFEANMSIKFGWLRLIKFVLGLCVVGHWNACIWYMVGSIADPGEPSWIKVQGLDWDDYYTAGDRYVASLYWAMMTLTTIGYGDIAAENTPERLYNISAMMICSLIFAYVVGTMCSLVQGLDVTNLQFQSMMDDINEYLQKNKVPKELRKRIRKYCLYQRDSTNHHNEAELMEFFSPALRNEVALHNYLPILEKITYFTTASNSFLTKLALHIKTTVFGPNEAVTSASNRIFNMYILMKGRIQVEKIDRAGMIYIAKELNRGAVFGEQALLFGGVGNTTNRTLTFCDVCYLQKKDFDHVITMHPIIGKKIKSTYVFQKWFDLLTNPEFKDALKRCRMDLDRGLKLDAAYNPWHGKRTVQPAQLTSSSSPEITLLQKEIQRVSEDSNRQYQQINSKVEAISGNVQKVLAFLQSSSAGGSGGK
jgi:potassium voltage-gated channel Eag-related subfamily H protein 7